MLTFTSFVTLGTVQSPQPAMDRSTSRAPWPTVPNTAPSALTFTLRGARMMISGASLSCTRPTPRTSALAPVPG